MRKKPKKTEEMLEMERESARLFGKHVSKEKGYTLLVLTLLVCAAPMLLGMRLWDQIPEIVPSGLIGSNGLDDSLPRWMVVYGLPGLMMLLDAICHGQLLYHQSRMTLPPTQVRLVGRWGFPILSVLFCSGMMRQAAGVTPVLPLTLTAPALLGLLLMMLGAHLWDCPQDAKIALRFSFCQEPEDWKAVHRFAGWLWLAMGFLLVLSVLLTDTLALPMAGAVVLSLAAPAAYGHWRSQAAA